MKVDANKVIAAVMAILLSVLAYVWHQHVEDFRDFKAEHREDMKEIVEAINEID